MPPHSLYQATKSSIEQGLFDLQHKMLQNKQLDLQNQLAHSLAQQQKIYRQQKEMLDLQQIYQDNLKYNNALLLRTACDPYANSLLYEPSLNDPTYLEHLENRRRETDQLEYLRRLERLNEQSLALENRATNGYRAQMYEDKINNYSSPIQQFSSRNSPSQSRGQDLRRSPSRPQNTSSYRGQDLRRSPSRPQNTSSYRGQDPRRSPSRPQNTSSYRGQDPHRSLSRPENLSHLQYDFPLEEDSSALLQKYSKGIRADEYNRDMERLIEIEKRLRNTEANPSASGKNPQGNESIVMPYQAANFRGQNRSGDQQQRLNAYQYKQQMNRGRQQKGLENIQSKGTSKPKRVDQTAEQHEKKENVIKQIFENEKIGKVINKQKAEEIPKAETDLSQKQSALEALNKFIKKAEHKIPLRKPVSITRPYASKPRKEGRGQTSQSGISNVSPSIGKDNRPRAKSSKPQKSSRSQNIDLSFKAKQTNSRLVGLDPGMQSMLQNILHSHINEKIQNRMQLLTCVFKDIKLRHERNEQEALVQRFQMETKARKEIKTMINNDPRILRKHRMVVE